MRVRRLFLPAALLCAVTLVSCGKAVHKDALMPGYYILDESAHGFTRRIIITAGERRASYDVWRVSRSGDGTAKHAHYDLIAADEAPSSGAFAITQEGSDCGSLSIENDEEHDHALDGILTVRYGVLGIEHFRLLNQGDATRYHDYDEAITRRYAQLANDDPRIYSGLSFFGKFFYSELTPHCMFD